jgi:hypothetical protein
LDYGRQDGFCNQFRITDENRSEEGMANVLDILNDIQGGENDELGFLVRSHGRYVGFKDLRDVFTILCGGSQLTSGLGTTRQTFAVPRAKNSRTTLLPSLVCTISASKSLQLRNVV